jgi:hypothetical protein
MSMLVSPSALLTTPVELARGDASQVLILSMRQVADLVGYCGMYEFEDIVAELTGADVAKVVSLEGVEFSRRLYKLARLLTRSRRLSDSLRPGRWAVPLETSYELFFPIFNHPYELFAINAIRGWRKRCRFAACYICEAWEAELPIYLIELLKEFDHIFIGVEGAREAVAEITGRPCSYLPMGVDAIRFCPLPDPPRRSIDVAGIGRRSRVTHQALLELARQQGFFYYYDTIQADPAVGSKHTTFRVSNPREHRLLLANILKRSRYFIANRAWADRPSLTRGKDEIAARFYEGIAGGAVILGEPPDSDDFRTQFDWADSVIRMPFDSPRVGELIAELDRDPARLAKIRADNVVNALLRHDWVYRLRPVLEVAGIPAPERLLAREARLRELSDRSGHGAGGA